MATVVDILWQYSGVFCFMKKKTMQHFPGKDTTK